MDRRIFDTIDRDHPAYDLDTWREEERQRRVARHESFHRVANEHAWHRLRRTGATSIRLMCECGDSGCTHMFVVPIGVFERYEQRGDAFLVTPGHEIDGLEEVVARGPNFFVVEKVGLGRLEALERWAERHATT